MSDFYRDLEYSHSQDEAPWWEEVYRKAFPLFQTMVNFRSDGEHQRAGIDRAVILSTSEQVLIDEKVRREAYDDILLEYVSNDRKNSPGWVCKPLRANYIAYAIAPKCCCFLLPVPQMQAAWFSHGEDWITKYRVPPARNNGYCTLNVAVPVDVLFQAMGNALRVRFTPETPKEPEPWF